MDPLQIPLKDIHLPAPISWWPLAPGWWMLLVLSLSILLAGVWMWRRRGIAAPRLSHASLRNEILQEWQRIRSTHLDNATDTCGLRELSEFLRRVALAVRPRAEAAALTGEAWLKYLDSFTTGNEFAHGCGKLLIDAPYKQAHRIGAADLRSCVDLCDRWIHTVLTKAGGKPDV
ncbi:MAG: DUF4381 domain-containing protein [Gammaproteobacteria bacterium]